MPTAAVPDGDRLFQHYTRKQQLVAWVSRTFFDRVTYTVRHGELAGMRRRGGLGWLPGFLSPANSTAEAVFWQKVNLDGLVVYDVGAFHGLLTLLFSRTAKQVVSFEPSARNRARLADNVRLNEIRNVTVRDVGLGAEARSGRMIWDPVAPGGAQILEAGAKQGEQVQVATMDEEVEAGLPKPDFIKIDVEGFELQVLEGGKRTLQAHHPTLFIEIHGDTMNQKKANVARVVAFLNSVGYADIRHVESAAAVTAANSEIAARGHLYCPRKAD